MSAGWWPRFWRAEKNASPKQDASVTEEAAQAMCGAAMALHNQIKSTLGSHKVQDRDFAEFISELLCYFLHMLDRELSGTTNARVRTEALDTLIRQLCREQYRVLYDLGLDVTEEQVLGIFQDQYNHRQLEYGSIDQDWFQRVAARFGEHAADALETPEDIRYEVAVKCCLLAPTTYADLSSVLVLFQKFLLNRKRRVPIEELAQEIATSFATVVGPQISDKCWVLETLSQPNIEAVRREWVLVHMFLRSLAFRQHSQDRKTVVTLLEHFHSLALKSLTRDGLLSPDERFAELLQQRYQDYSEAMGGSKDLQSQVMKVARRFFDHCGGGDAGAVLAATGHFLRVLVAEKELIEELEKDAIIVA